MCHPAISILKVLSKCLALEPLGYIHIKPYIFAQLSVLEERVFEQSSSGTTIHFLLLECLPCFAMSPPLAFKKVSDAFTSDALVGIWGLRKKGKLQALWVTPTSSSSSSPSSSFLESLFASTTFNSGLQCIQNSGG